MVLVLSRSHSVSKEEVSALDWLLETNSVFPVDSKGSQAAICVLLPS